VEQSIENFEGTKVVNIGSESCGDIQAGIQFIYDIQHHVADIAIATVYGLVIYAAVLWITKKIKEVQ